MLLNQKGPSQAMYGIGNQQAICQHLLRRECAAWHAYDEIIDRFEGSPFENLILLIQRGHQANLNFLVGYMIQDGGTPVLSSDFRGKLATSLTSSAELLGHGPVIAALRMTENDCLREYERALTTQATDSSLLKAVSRSLIPSIENHIATLDLMI